MNFSELFIRRPVMTTLVMLAILLFGAMAYRLLPVNDLPAVDFPTIVVSANLPGASPETMAAAVATPLERQFSTIAGLDSMSSSNSQGSTQITLQFSLDRDIDAAAQDVQSQIARAQRQLPADMPNPPSYRKVNPADSPILFLALSSPVLPLSTVNEYAETMISQRISSVTGVAQVQVFGSQKYAVRIQLNPLAMAARSIGINEVVDSIRRGNVNLPSGTLHGTERAFTLEAEGQLTEAKAYRPLIVAYRNGAPVRLEEIGTVLDSVENTRQASWFKDTRAVVLAVQRQPGTNTVQVVDAIMEMLPSFQAQLPAAVNLEVLFDRSQSIRESVNEVKFTLMLTICLVILVIFLFLRSGTATVIPSLALPLSVIGTFAAMHLMGFSINNLTLLGLTLAVGFVVDDAIVMLENIMRHREHGEGRLQAALRGSKEIVFTIISMTLSLTAVFIPVLFLGGVPGRLLHEFAVTIGVAILISGFVSLTLTPMLSSRFLTPPGMAHHGRLYAASEGVFNGMRAIYDVTLRFVLRHKFATMVFSLLVLLGTIHLFREIPRGFLPDEDTGQLTGSTEAAQGTSYEAMVRLQRQVADIIQADPNVAAFMSNVGGGNTGRFFIRLKPLEERELSAEEVVAQLRPKVAQVPGIQVFLRTVPVISLGGRMSKSLYQYTLQSADTEELYRYAPILEDRLREVPGLIDVTSDLQLNNPQVKIDIDRDKASALGISAEQIESTLYGAYGSRQVSTILAATDQYPVIIELDPKYQRDPSALSKLYVRSSEGKQIPLNAVAKLSVGAGPLTVNHQGQLPAVTLSFNVAPGVALGDAVARVEALARETLPGNITGGFQGTAQVFADSMKSLGLLLVLSILVIYLVLGILYESFIHPLTIFSGLPSAGFGALLALMIFDKPLDLYGFVGVIMLVGLVKKNSIMMIDFALEAQRNEGKSPTEAIYQGCMIRFRPIMMTTMAALMGTLPIAIGFGAGAEARRPLGLAVVGGLVFSQFLTLYITPVFFIYMEKLRSFFTRKKAPQTMTESEAEAESEEAAAK